MDDPPERGPRVEAPLVKDEPAAASTDKPEKPVDVVYVHGPTPSGVQITRLRDDRVEAGELRPMKEGQPISGEVVKLSRRAEHERLFDVEVVANTKPQTSAQTDEPARGRKGPSRVSNERFRMNWDLVFGGSSHRKGDLPS